MATKIQPVSLEDIVSAGGGKLVQVASGLVSFVDPQSGATLILPIMLATPKRVSQTISDHRRKRCAERN
jgi:hypothetical protein